VALSDRVDRYQQREMKNITRPSEANVVDGARIHPVKHCGIALLVLLTLVINASAFEQKDADKITREKDDMAKILEDGTCPKPPILETETSLSETCPDTLGISDLNKCQDIVQARNNKMARYNTFIRRCIEGRDHPK
jgi:hypothetical protein